MLMAVDSNSFIHLRVLSDYIYLSRAASIYHSSLVMRAGCCGLQLFSET
jgi:hypothetical protein